jgi:hypothetical protein
VAAQDIEYVEGGIHFTILEQDPMRKPGRVQGFLSRNGGSGVQNLVDFLRTPGPCGAVDRGGLAAG